MQVASSQSPERKLFFLRALKNPRQLGSITPSSRYLGQLLAKHANVDDTSPIVELGGGTGSLTRSLISAGVEPSRIYVIELDAALANYLTVEFPGVNVIQGDATNLENILPKKVLGKVKRVVSGIPMINVPESIRGKILESAFNVLEKGGIFLQYTYAPRSSINAKAHGLIKKRLGTIFRNFPPASVWQYSKD